MKRVGLFILVVSFCVTVNTASAQLIADVAQKAGAGRLEGGGVLSISEVEYELDDGDNADVKRNVLGAYAATSISDRTDIFGALGAIVKTEVDGSDDSGTGVMLSGGLRIDLMDIDLFDILAYGKGTYISEDYGDDIDGSIFEIAAGLIAKASINQDLNIYGGLDLYPVSSGEAESMGVTLDMERDSLFGLRIGGNIDLGSLWLRGEISFVGETALTIGAGTYF